MSRSHSIPEELIKIKAQEFWKKRLREGRDGTPEDSRIEAKQYLEKHRWEIWKWKLTKTLSQRPIKKFADWWETTAIEKFLEDIEFLLQKSAFLTILGSLSNLAIIVAVVTFIFGENVRRNNEVFTAWQTITSAEGQTGSGGRIEALQFLNERPWRLPWIGWTEKDWYWDNSNQKCKQKRLIGLRWGRQNLYGLSIYEAHLPGIHLCGAKLWYTNLEKAYLPHANLQGAQIGNANLKRVLLFKADLKGALIYDSNLEEAYLHAANLMQANLLRSNLKGAILLEAFITPRQIKSACFWEEAIFFREWNDQKGTYVAKEPENTNYIEELKKDTASNPTKKPDCSFWKK